MSKDKLDTCLSIIDDQQKVTIKATRSFSNKSEGYAKLRTWLKSKLKAPITLSVAMEATGVYHEQLAWDLHQYDYRVSIVLPNKAKRYLQALGLKSKNDKIDARGLARMGAEQHLEAWAPPSNQLYTLRQVTRHHEQLQAAKTQYKNQLHAIKHNRIQNPNIEIHLTKIIDLLDEQLQETSQQIQNCIDKDPILKKQVDNICSIKGLGLLSVATIIAETDGFALFKNQRQLTSYAGYDVIENQSGKHNGKTKISKRGNAHIRRILHMPAFNVVRFTQGQFRNLFERVLRRTGQKMKAYVAVQRKLLTIIYALWKNNQPYDPLYQQAHTQYQNDDYKTNSTFCKSPFNATTKLVGGVIFSTPPTQDKLLSEKPAEAFFNRTNLKNDCI